MNQPGSAYYSIEEPQKSHVKSVLYTRWRRLQLSLSSGGTMSLKSQTLYSILKDKKFFCDLAKLQPNKNPYNKISNSLKKELIELQAKKTHNIITGEYDVVEIEMECQMLKLLMNKKITTFNFPIGLHSDNQAAATELWQSLLAELPPDLQTITRNSCLNFLRNPWQMKPFFDRLLTLIPNLEVLQLEQFVCNNSDLHRISDHLPKLRVLEVKLDRNVSRSGITALCKLKKLQEFVFVDSPYVELRWLELCWEVLPHLHVAGNRGNRFRFHDLMMVLGECTGETLATIRTTRTLQLRHLVLRSLVFIPDAVSLPEVEVLFLIEPWHSIILTGRFTKLSELNTYGTSADELMRIVGHVGRQLQTLRASLSDVVQLDELLQACPNLSELDLASGGLQKASELQPDTVRRLRLLYIGFLPSTLGTVQPGLLVQLLKSAPKVRTLQFSFSRLDSDHVQELTELVNLAQQRLVLRWLQETSIKLDAKNCIITESQRHFLGQVAYKLVMHCPRLYALGT